MLGLVVICQIIVPQGERWHVISFVDGIDVLMAFELVNFNSRQPIEGDSEQRAERTINHLIVLIALKRLFPDLGQGPLASAEAVSGVAHWGRRSQGRGGARESRMTTGGESGRNGRREVGGCGGLRKLEWVARVAEHQWRVGVHTLSFLPYLDTLWQLQLDHFRHLDTFQWYRWAMECQTG